MRTLHFRRFTNPALLRRAGRHLLERFFARFQQPQFASQGPRLPGPEAEDEVYFDAVAGVLLRPEDLPDELNDALFAIEEMASEEGRARLEQAVEDAALEMSFLETDTHLDVALQVWLMDPALLAQKYNESRMLRLRRFEYFSADRETAGRTAARAPTQESLAALTSGLDEWLARNRRGHGTARVEWYSLAGEWWFLIRRGDNFTRTTRLETDGPRILHFRPQRDEVVVYNREDDELRINASLKSVRDLYRREFGLLLRGDEEYFNCRQAYTLEPLRTLRAEGLRGGVGGIESIRLTEVEVVLDQGMRQFTVMGAWDLLEAGPSEKGAPIIPLHGRISSACFDFQFEGAERAHPVRVCPPNVLKLGRHCDSHAVNTWLKRMRIRTSGGWGLHADERSDPRRGLRSLSS